MPGIRPFFRVYRQPKEDDVADGDADQETGADQEVTDAGEAGEQDADAGQESGATGGSDDNPYQTGYNRGAKEAREALEGKIESLEQQNSKLESKLDELSSEDGDSDEPTDLDPEDRDDVYTESQVKEMKRSYQSDMEEREQELEELRSRVEATNRQTAKNRLIEALREHNVIKPEVFAETLIAQGRLEAEIADGDDAFTVYTEDGNKMLNGEGEDATPEDLAASWVSENPEFQEAAQRQGAGYSDTGGSAKKGYKPANEMSDAEKRDFIREEGREAWDEHVSKSYSPV